MSAASNPSDVSASDLHLHGNLVLKGVAVVNPKSSQKVKIGTISPGVIIAPKTPLKEVDIIFPKSVTDGQIMFLSFTQDIGTVNFVNAKFANKSSLSSVKAGDTLTLFYHEGTDKWYKLSGGSSGGAATSAAPDTTEGSTDSSK